MPRLTQPSQPYLSATTIQEVNNTNSTVPLVRQAPRHGNVPPIRPCNIQELGTIVQQLGLKQQTATQNNQIKKETHCPDRSAWLDRYYYEKNVNKQQKDDDEDNYFIGINVGCNKGLDAMEMGYLGTFDEIQFNKTRWAQTMRTIVVMEDGQGNDFGPGACHQVQDAIVAPDASMATRLPTRNQQHIRSTKGEIHCIEPLPTNFDLLQRTFQRYQQQQMKEEEESLPSLPPDAVVSGNNGPQFILSNVAIGASDGTVQFPKTTTPGKEDVGMEYCKRQIENSRKDCQDISKQSLVTYYEQHVRRQDLPIHVLVIDVEGFDNEVLFGAGPILDITQYLEFEYHVALPWRYYRLTDTIQLLDSKGFTCYWAGKSKLWRITQCLHDTYDTWHGWSNVACVHRSQTDLAKRMEQVFQETLRG